jgi:hypothetical protein
MSWFGPINLSKLKKRLKVTTTPKDIRETIRANYLQPAFLICAGVLGITVIAMSVAVKLSGIYLKKEPLPLKKPLTKLDSSNLTPYKVVSKKDIENLDVLETLGTEDYIQWNLEDTSAPEASNTRFCSLFITYYQLPDIVPHRPEECYIGGGFQQKISETVTLEINGDEQRQIDARYLVFTGTERNPLAGETTFSVFYVFRVNGEYAGGRDRTRRILNKNLFGKFSYFSKVEWKFCNNSLGRTTYPNKQEALAASKKLLAVILPVLEKEHWPSGLW